MEAIPWKVGQVLEGLLVVALEVEEVAVVELGMVAEVGHLELGHRWQQVEVEVCLLPVVLT